MRLDKMKDIRFILVGILIIISLLLPFFLPDAYVYLVGMTYLFIIMVVSWDVIVGYTGQVNLGHTVFVGIGAYTTALLQVPSRFEGTFLHFLSAIPSPPIYISIIIGGLVSAFFGFLIGVITLRLRGYYFALVTAVLPLVFIQFLYVWSDIFGGEEGFSVGLERALAGDSTGKYYIAFFIMIFSVLVMYFIIKSHIGYKFRAIRDDETLAESVGIDTVRYKVLSFVISSFFAGIAGACVVHYRITVGPSMFDIPLMLLIILSAVIGGLGTLFGPIVGGFIIYLMKNWWLKGLTGFSSVVPINDEIVLYIILIAVAILAPEGIWVYSRKILERLPFKLLKRMKTT